MTGARFSATCNTAVAPYRWGATMSILCRFVKPEVVLFFAVALPGPDVADRTFVVIGSPGSAGPGCVVFLLRPCRKVVEPCGAQQNRDTLGGAFFWGGAPAPPN